LNARGATDWVPRFRALEAVRRVVLDGESLTVSLADETEGLTVRDAAWSRALAYTTIRWYLRLDTMVDGMLERPLKARDAVIRVLLCQGLAEIFHFGTPDHAAVRETAELARTLQRPGAVPLVNALLRRALRERSEMEAAMNRTPSLRYACPPWLVSGIRSGFPDSWEKRLEASTLPAPMTLRVNLARSSRETAQGRLREAGFEAAVHPWVDSALVLETPVDVERLPGFSEGLLSVQDAAAQWAARILAPRNGERVLDACAAPGGKTGHLLETVDGELRLTALDVDGNRLGKVRDNLRRLGYTAALVVGDLARAEDWWDGQLFDAILLDVPCSATGVIRRHPDIKLLRSPSDIGALVQRQRQLLEASWALLRPGGRLLYVTCSLLGDENEGVVAPWLAHTRDARHEALDFPGGIDRTVGRSIPLGWEGMDGFYYALFSRDA